MYDSICILGPTASGKTSIAVGLAYSHKGEIISADSRQIYRGMDIGTGKDICEYEYEGHKIPYHLIDIVDAGEKYNLFKYKTDFTRAWKEIISRGVLPIICGGSGLYLESVIQGYEMREVPENTNLRKELSTYSLEELARRLASYRSLHNTTDIDTKKRAIRAIEIEEYYKIHPYNKDEALEINPLIIGMDLSRDLRREKINKRLKSRLEEGMINEVKELINSGISPEDLIYYGLEYKYVTNYVLGNISYEEMFSRLNIAIHQFAKRQMTWFRKMERAGIKIHWVDCSLPKDDILKSINRFFLG